MNDNDVSIEQHKDNGLQLKRAIHCLEILSLELRVSYQDNDRIASDLNRIGEKLTLAQAKLHSRMIREFPDLSDDELLPIYLGRYDSLKDD